MQNRIVKYCRPECYGEGHSLQDAVKHPAAEDKKKKRPGSQRFQKRRFIFIK